MSALLPHWEPRAKVMRMLTTGTCGVFKELSKKQVKNLKVGIIRRGDVVLALLIPTLLEREWDCACGGTQDQFYAVWFFAILGEIITW